MFIPFKTSRYFFVLAYSSYCGRNDDTRFLFNHRAYVSVRDFGIKSGSCPKQFIPHIICTIRRNLSYHMVYNTQCTIERLIGSWF